MPHAAAFLVPLPDRTNDTSAGGTNVPSSTRCEPLPAVWQARPVLDETGRRTLDLEASWWRYADTREAAIRVVLDEDRDAYFRRLGRLLDDPDALAHAPVLVRRLRRQRNRRIGSRSGRRLVG